VQLLIGVHHAMNRHILHDPRNKFAKSDVLISSSVPGLSALTDSLVLFHEEEHERPPLHEAQSSLKQSGKRLSNTAKKTEKRYVFIEINELFNRKPKLAKALKYAIPITARNVVSKYIDVLYRVESRRSFILAKH